MKNPATQTVRPGRAQGEAFERKAAKVNAPRIQKFKVNRSIGADHLRSEDHLLISG